MKYLNIFKLFFFISSRMIIFLNVFCLSASYFINICLSRKNFKCIWVNFKYPFFALITTVISLCVGEEVCVFVCRWSYNRKLRFFYYFFCKFSSSMIKFVVLFALCFVLFKGFPRFSRLSCLVSENASKSSSFPEQSFLFAFRLNFYFCVFVQSFFCFRFRFIFAWKEG